MDMPMRLGTALVGLTLIRPETQGHTRESMGGTMGQVGWKMSYILGKFYGFFVYYAPTVFLFYIETLPQGKFSNSAPTGETI